MPTDQKNLTFADKIKKVLRIKVAARKEPTKSPKPLEETKSGSLSKKPSEKNKGFFRLPKMFKRKKPAPPPEVVSNISDSNLKKKESPLKPDSKEKSDDSPKKKKKWFIGIFKTKGSSVPKKTYPIEERETADQVQSLTNIFKEIQKKGDLTDDLSKLMPSTNIPNQKVTLGQILKVNKIVKKVMADVAISGEPVDPTDVLNKVMISMNMPAIDKETADKIMAMSQMLIKKLAPSKLVPEERLMDKNKIESVMIKEAELD